MNNYKLLYIFFCGLLAAAFFLAGCSKDNSPSPSAVASLNVVNSIPTSLPLILIQGQITTEIGHFYGIGGVSYGGSAVITPRSGSEILYVIQKNVDTATVNVQGGGDFLFINSLNFSAGSLYSLFLTGSDTSHPDYLFVRDAVSQRTDSTVGVRFVNLSTGSSPVSVDIQGQAVGGVVPSVSYKGITGFISFPATSTISSYVFEFRDAVSGNLLTSYTLSGVNTNDPTTSTANTVLFRNLTIALIGQPSGGKIAQKCIRINSF